VFAAFCELCLNVFCAFAQETKAFTFGFYLPQFVRVASSCVPHLARIWQSFLRIRPRGDFNGKGVAFVAEAHVLSSIDSVNAGLVPSVRGGHG
jgi:hypothetical protein